MEAAYRVLAEHAPELVARHDRDGTFLYLSAASLTLLGLQPSELLGKDALALVAAADREGVRATLRELLAGARHEVHYRARYQHADGRSLWLDVTAYPVPDGPDQLTREYVTVARVAERERDMESALQNSEELLGAVLANMDIAHLRFDLEGTILQINPAGLRLLGFEHTAQLLGKSVPTQLSLLPTCFNELLAQVQREGVAAVDAPLRRRDGMLRQVQGALRLHRDANHAPVFIDSVLRDVTDERKASEELTHAREAAEADSRAKSLFLANASHEIRAPMNDILDVSKIEAAKLTLELVPATKSASERPKPLSGVTVLVVEDNEINQILARDLLESAGASVVLASDGREAIRLASERTPGFDVILMDVQMPGMDGHATTRELRRLPKTADTPVIAMTAHAFDAERSKCIASGMNAHVAKPINPRDLVQTVRTWALRDSADAPEGALGPPARPAEDALRPAARPARGATTSRIAEEPVPPDPRSPPSQVAAEAAPPLPSFEDGALAVVFKDPARQLAFLRRFVDAARVTLAELDQAGSARDHGHVGFLGHKLKSSAKACGAHALASLLGDLERYAKVPDWTVLEPLLRSSHALLDEVIQHVERAESATRERPQVRQQ